MKKVQGRGIFFGKPDICVSPAKDGVKREYNEKLKHNCGWLLIRKRQNRMKKAMRHTVHLSKGTGAFCLHTSSGIGVPLIRMLSECRLFCCPESR